MSDSRQTLVPIVIPVFNVDKTTKRLLKSLINQSYPEDKYEIIVVDDGSTDGTMGIVMSAAKEKSKPNIKIIKLEYNRGARSSDRQKSRNHRS